MVRLVLQMYEEMHVLSPFVPSREFYLLRYCEQVEAGTWVIANVSYDYSKEDGLHSSTWMFPSGCLIHQISNEYSKVGTSIFLFL
jgi:homeobox-leucine zipper protein